MFKCPWVPVPDAQDDGAWDPTMHSMLLPFVCILFADKATYVHI